MKKNSYFYYSFFLYGLSILLPVTGFDWGFIGLQAMIMPLFGLVEGELDMMFLIPWSANFTFLAMILLRNKNISLRILISVFTVVFSLFSIPYFKLPFQEVGLFDAYVGPGYFLWMLSFVFMLISQIKEYKKTAAETRRFFSMCRLI